MKGNPRPQERVLRDYLYDHPELLFTEPIVSRHREVHIEGKFVDLLFEVDGIHHIVELKRDTITREAVGQVLEYYGRLRQAYPERKYQVVLAAPNIPKYRSIPLEEFGIRCVEVSFPEQEAQYPLVTELAIPQAARVRSALHRSSPLSDVESFLLDCVPLEALQPPCTQPSVRIARKLLFDSIPKIQALFADYEVMPVAMVRPNTQDVLCLETEDPSAPCDFVQSNAWWAFAFGKSEQVAKNNTPNISVNAYRWGMDFAVNAELRTSQASLLATAHRNPDEMDRLVRDHGHLTLQFWLKLEHQPRFYHWIPLSFVPVDQWGASILLSKYSDLNTQYPALREEWLTRIVANQPQLSSPQAAHMRRKNNEMNLAIRLVSTIVAENSIWSQPYNDQLAAFEREYVALKPLIQFFN